MQNIMVFVSFSVFPVAIQVPIFKGYRKPTRDLEKIFYNLIRTRCTVRQDRIDLHHKDSTLLIKTVHSHFVGLVVFRSCKVYNINNIQAYPEAQS